MVYGGYNYIDLEYEPDTKNDFVVLHWVESTQEIEKTAEAIAAESSVGTWTELRTVNVDVFEKYRAKVFKINATTNHSGFVWIAYPLEHFDTANLLQVLASIRGNIFGLAELKALKFLDITIPERFLRNYKGPQFGISGIRKMISSSDRPHLGTIVKPKVGLSPKEWASVAYDAYAGGIDFVKDDENLVDQKFCRWEKRMNEMIKVVDKIEKETGRYVLYSPNITGSYTAMIKRLDYLANIGWKIAMIDVYISGYAALQSVLEHAAERKIAIHGHRAGYGAESRGRFGTQFPVFAKVWRMLGVDQLHTGTGVGKMEGSPVMIKRYADILRAQSLHEALYCLSLGQKWHNIAPVLPVASGGLSPGTVEALMEIFGRDVVIQAGGGIHGHPQGTRAGAKAMHDAMVAALEGKSIEEAMKKSNELRMAIKKWGYVSPNSVREKINFMLNNKSIIENTIMTKGYDTFVYMAE